MKKYLLLPLLIMGIQVSARAQDLVAYLQAEYTVAGSQYGSSFIYETKSKWGAGVFYQAELATRSELHSRKDTFLGATLQAPLVKSKRLSFFGQLRAGVANKNFVIVVPGLETRLNISPRFGTSFGMSLRMGYPSINGKLFLYLF